MLQRCFSTNRCVSNAVFLMCVCEPYILSLIFLSQCSPKTLISCRENLRLALRLSDEDMTKVALNALRQRLNALEAAQAEARRQQRQAEEAGGNGGNSSGEWWVCSFKQVGDRRIRW